MTRDERRPKLESFGNAPTLLSSALRRYPKKMWLYKPGPERWSIHEIILHLADSEASAYVRSRRFIAEPGSQALQQFDAARWARSLGYYHQSTREALEIIRRLRKMTYQLLSAVPESVWLHRVDHSGEGSLSLEDWLDRQERHIPHHIEQMGQNFEIWQRAHPPRKPATPTARTSMPTGMTPLIAGI